jgi:hypothetical protein
MKTLSEPAIVSSRKACFPTIEHPQATRDGVLRKDQNANGTAIENFYACKGMALGSNRVEL